jgi:hypothetical protein
MADLLSSENYRKKLTDKLKQKRSQVWKDSSNDKWEELAEILLEKESNTNLYKNSQLKHREYNKMIKKIETIYEKNRRDFQNTFKEIDSLETTHFSQEEKYEIFGDFLRKKWEYEESVDCYIKSKSEDKVNEIMIKLSDSILKRNDHYNPRSSFKNIYMKQKELWYKKQFTELQIIEILEKSAMRFIKDSDDSVADNIYKSMAEEIWNKDAAVKWYCKLWDLSLKYKVYAWASFYYWKMLNYLESIDDDKKSLYLWWFYNLVDYFIFDGRNISDYENEKIISVLKVLKDKEKLKEWLLSANDQIKMKIYDALAELWEKEIYENWYKEMAEWYISDNKFKYALDIYLKLGLLGTEYLELWDRFAEMWNIEYTKIAYEKSGLDEDEIKDRLKQKVDFELYLSGKRKELALSYYSWNHPSTDMYVNKEMWVGVIGVQYSPGYSWDRILFYNVFWEQKTLLEKKFKSWRMWPTGISNDWKKYYML